MKMSWLGRFSTPLSRLSDARVVKKFPFRNEVGIVWVNGNGYATPWREKVVHVAEKRRVCSQFFFFVDTLALWH